MSLYPTDARNDNSLYPSDESELRNPMNKNLDCSGYDITNISEIDMIGDGDIEGVITINGQPYPAPYPTIPTTRSQTFLFPQLQNPLPPNGSGGALAQLFVIYDYANGDNTQLQGVFGDSSINVIQLTMPFSVIQTASAIGPLGYIDLYLFVNGASVQHEGQIGVSANHSYSGSDAEANGLPTCTFNLVRGVHWTSNADVVSLWGQGTYNFTYYFNYIMIHGDQPSPTVCRAVGFP